MSRDKAKTILKNYFGILFGKAGMRLDNECYDELDSFVDLIWDTAKEEIRQEAEKKEVPPDMHKRLEAFFSPEITVEPVRGKYEELCAADQESGRMLKRIFGRDWLKRSEYDEVLAAVSKEGYSLCTLEDEDEDEDEE